MNQPSGLHQIPPWGKHAAVDRKKHSLVFFNDQTNISDIVSLNQDYRCFTMISFLVWKDWQVASKEARKPALPKCQNVVLRLQRMHQMRLNRLSKATSKTVLLNQ